MNTKNQATAFTVAREKPTLADLESENTRLQRLVADLLVKNQQLRAELKAAQRPPSYASNFGSISNN